MRHSVEDIPVSERRRLCSGCGLRAASARCWVCGAHVCSGCRRRACRRESRPGDPLLVKTGGSYATQPRLM